MVYMQHDFRRLTTATLTSSTVQLDRLIPQLPPLLSRVKITAITRWISIVRWQHIHRCRHLPDHKAIVISQQQTTRSSPTQLSTILPSCSHRDLLRDLFHGCEFATHVATYSYRDTTKRRIVMRLQFRESGFVLQRCDALKFNFYRVTDSGADQTLKPTCRQRILNPEYRQLLRIPSAVPSSVLL